MDAAHELTCCVSANWRLGTLPRSANLGHLGSAAGVVRWSGKSCEILSIKSGHLVIRADRWRRGRQGRASGESYSDLLREVIAQESNTVGRNLKAIIVADG